MSIQLRQIPRASVIDYEVTNLLIQTGKQLPDEGMLRLLSKNLMLSYRRKASPEELRERAELIITGKKIPILPSIFHGKTGPRHGKDVVYRHFWSLVRRYIRKHSQRHYIGLPANQIGGLPILIGGSIDVCEKDKKLAEWQKQYASLLEVEMSINNEDIFSFMDGKLKWNVIDLDLMTIATMPFVEKTVEAINKGAVKKGNIVINLTSCIGRAISWKQYKEIMPVAILDGLVDKWFDVVEVRSSAYRDRRIPIAVEQIVVRR